MKRKTSSLETRIWTYGCLEPDAPTKDRIQSILRTSHRYYNLLVEMERSRREQYRGLGSPSEQDAPLCKEADAEMSARLDAACAAAAGPSSTGRPGPRTIARLKPAVVSAMLADPRWPKVWKDRTSLASDFNEMRRAVRKVCGIPPGTYLLVESAFDSSCRGPRGPQFHPWDGSGRVGVLVRREPAARVMSGESNAVRIVPRGPDMLRGAAPRADRLEVQLRIGPGTESIRLAVVLHRPLPDGAVVTGAWLLVRRVGPDTKYSLQLTVEHESFTSRTPDPVLPSVAIDVGWRRRPGGVRAAYWVDSDGGHGEILVPESIMNGLDHCSGLEAARAAHHNRALALFNAWLRLGRPPMSDGLREYSSHSRLWKSPQRLARFVATYAAELGVRDALASAWVLWRDSRLSAGLDLFATYSEVRVWAVRTGVPVDPFVLYLDFWRRKNRHLFTWSEHRRQKLLGRRDDVFRNEAARIARSYGRVAFENLDNRPWARDASPDEDPDPDRAHRIRNVASPGKFRALVKSAVGPHRLSEEEMADSTRECHLCGHVNVTWTSPRALVQTCAGCGSSWDQDFNAASVLLHRLRARLVSGAPPAASRGRSRPRRQAA